MNSILFLLAFQRQLGLCVMEELGLGSVRLETRCECLVAELGWAVQSITVDRPARPLTRLTRQSGPAQTQLG